MKQITRTYLEDECPTLKDRWFQLFPVIEGDFPDLFFLLICSSEGKFPRDLTLINVASSHLFICMSLK